MGVSYVMQWTISEGKSVLKTIEDLQSQIEKMGGVKGGLFSVEVESYSSNNDPNKILQTVTNSEYPASTFAWFEDGSSVVCDNLLPSFLMKLGEHWQLRKGGKMECKGPRYTLNDFIIKIGVVTQSSSSKGVAIEVEYTPCLIYEECKALMLEFTTSLFRNDLPVPPQAIPTLQLNTKYAPQHTARQYVSLFNTTFLKSANVR